MVGGALFGNRNIFGYFHLQEFSWRFSTSIYSYMANKCKMVILKGAKLLRDIVELSASTNGIPECFKHP